MNTVTKEVTYEDYNNFSGSSEMNLVQVLDLFGSMRWERDAFLYFDIDKINVFQVFYQKENTFLIEISDDSEDMIYSQKYADYKESVDLLAHFFNQISFVPIIGFYKVPVNSKTLDDILKETN